MNQPVIDYYQQTLAKKGYKEDAAQKKAVTDLQRLCNELNDPKFRQQQASQSSESGGGLLSRFFKNKNVEPQRPKAPQGVYMWGGVGRGKSFLMDCFFKTCPCDRKIRIHFHEFMRSVHQRMRDIKNTENPLDVLAKDLATKYKLICFDEFHVSNIADGMVLYRLLLALVNEGCVFVMTSNYEPSTIYPDGLNRDRILPAIDLIKETMNIINVDIGVDYRHRALEQAQLYYQPITDENRKAFQELYENQTGEEPKETELTVENRSLKAVGASGKVVWFTFAELCETARSQNDYISLADEFDTIMVSDVPKMDVSMASPARRFTWLIDVLYDFKVKLVMLAECPAEELYTQGTLANEFTRTVSRIVEMQSKSYLREQRRKDSHF